MESKKDEQDTTPEESITEDTASARKPTAKKGAASLAYNVQEALDIAIAANKTVEANRQAIDAAASGQKRLTSIASGALIGALTCLTIGVAVYLRSIGDLRDAASIQAAANKAAIEQIQSIDDAMGNVQNSLDRVNALEAQMIARIEGLGDRLSSDLKTAIAQTTDNPAQLTEEVQQYIGKQMQQMRGEVLTALVEFERNFILNTIPPQELRALLSGLAQGKNTTYTEPSKTTPNTPSLKKKVKPKTASPRKKAASKAPSVNPYSFGSPSQNPQNNTPFTFP